jgi:hypothetical protein
VNKRQSWKFSQGGAALFLLALMAPFIIGLLRVLPTHSNAQWWRWPLLGGVALFFMTLLWFVSVRPLLQQSLWKEPRTWYEGCFGIGILYTFYAAFVFVTGYTPTRYHSHPVPRSTGVIYLYWAAVPLIIASASYVYAARGKKSTRSK